jgi:2-dehydro-3-deoxyphosphooctonate aldolase (KDO 8-P synthase)
MVDTIPAFSDYKLGFKPTETFFIIAGPCVIESEEITMSIAAHLAEVGKDLGIPIVFKASFDKANRTSVDSYRGPGIRKGLEILAAVRAKTGLPVTSDIHTPDQAQFAGEVLDIIQIPAFLSRQTDLLVAAGRTGRCVNIKKGQFQAPDNMKHAVQKVLSTGNRQILLTERGSTFGYNDVVADMRSMFRMREFGFPIIFDATHSSQFPGAGEGKSGGDRRLIGPLARAAVAAGANGVFIETHPNPDAALCDGPNSLNLTAFRDLVTNLKLIYDIVPRETASASSSVAPEARFAGRKDALMEKLKKIRLLIFDVDGVLTNGGITFGTGDLEIKSFHVRDGHGIKIATRSGLKMAFVTGRSSDAVGKRARELGIEKVFQGMKDKRPALAELIEEYKLSPDEVAVVGDDIVDIPLMRRVGVSFAVPEASADVLKEVDVITRASGGQGAAREIIEMILKAQDKWDSVMARYYA